MSKLSPTPSLAPPISSFPAPVCLIGAGCGDVSLLTLRGRERLACCEVLLYDALIDPVFLRLVPPTCEALCVGKRAHHPSASQEEISALLIQKAQEGRRVVRLKGGDPFVFGRGGEEVLALRAANIPCEVIPGISSAIAVPAHAGIPVTHRGLSRSFHVITAHTSEELLPAELECYAGLPGTLVFLMGLSALPELSARLIAAGKSADTPSAVISCGCTEKERSVRASLSEIAEAAQRASLPAPAVIVIGETAALDLRPISCTSEPASAPLAGITVGLTGTEHLLSQLQEGLSRLGAASPILCRLRLREKEDLTSLRELLDRICEAKAARTSKTQKNAPDWLLFTSANGVSVFFHKLDEWGYDLRSLAHVRFGVIGRGTATALRQHHLSPDLMPSTYTTLALARALIPTLSPGEAVALLRAEEGSSDLPSALAEAHVPFEDIPLYDLCTEEDSGSIALWEDSPVPDYLTFGSASGVRRFFSSHAGQRLLQSPLEPGSLPVPVCIGPVTAAELQNYWSGRFLIAGEATAAGLLACILHDVTAR